MIANKLPQRFLIIIRQRLPSSSSSSSSRAIAKEIQRIVKLLLEPKIFLQSAPKFLRIRHLHRTVPHQHRMRIVNLKLQIVLLRRHRTHPINHTNEIQRGSRRNILHKTAVLIALQRPMERIKVLRKLLRNMVVKLALKRLLKHHMDEGQQKHPRTQKRRADKMLVVRRVHLVGRKDFVQTQGTNASYILGKDLPRSLALLHF